MTFSGDIKNEYAKLAKVQIRLKAGPVGTFCDYRLQCFWSGEINATSEIMHGQLKIKFKIVDAVLQAGHIGKCSVGQVKYFHDVMQECCLYGE